MLLKSLKFAVKLFTNDAKLLKIIITNQDFTDLQKDLNNLQNCYERNYVFKY
jgi:hypothetical protein